MRRLAALLLRDIGGTYKIIFVSVFLRINHKIYTLFGFCYKLFQVIIFILKVVISN